MAAAPCFALETSATEADVSRQAWLRKVSELQVRPTDTGAVALFRSGLPLTTLRVKVSAWKRVSAIERARLLELKEDEWLARRSEPVPAPTSQSVARRSPMQAIMELIPALTPGEQRCVLFKFAAMGLPAVESRETSLLECKQRMQQILRERPIAAWGEALAPFVQAALQEAGDRRVYFRSDDATLCGLSLLYAHPPREWGYKRTRRPELDPRVRVVDVLKESFHALRVNEPLHFPGPPPPDAGRAFTVVIQLQDLHEEWSAPLRVPWHSFCENPSWKASVDVDFTLWASTRERWCYSATPRSIYSFADWQEQNQCATIEERPSSVGGLIFPGASPRVKRDRAVSDDERDAEMQRDAEKRARIGCYNTADIDPEVWLMMGEFRQRRMLTDADMRTE